MNTPYDPDYSAYPQLDNTESHFHTTTSTSIQSGTPTMSVMAMQPITPTSTMTFQNGNFANSGRSAHSDNKRGIQSAMRDSKFPLTQPEMQVASTGNEFSVFQIPMHANAHAIINPTHMTSYGSAADETLPQTHELLHAKGQAEHIYKEYHPDGGEVTNDATRAGFFKNFELDNIPKSADLSQIQDDVDTHFPDALTAEFYRVAARPRKDAQKQDRTIPTTAIALRAHVKTLIHAFNSWRNADDNPGMLTPFKKQIHDQKLVEATCWSLLKACIDRSQSDLPLLFAWDQAKSRESAGHETFAKRFDAMVLSMFQSKTICKHLFDAPYSHIFVDDPTRAQGRVRANRDLNKQKAQHMSAGKRLAEEEAKKNGTYNPSKRAKRTRETTMTSETSEPSAPRTPTNDHLSYLGDSPGGRAHSPFTPTDQEPARGSTRHTQRPTSYAQYSPAQSTPGAYDSPIQANDTTDDEEDTQEVKAEGRAMGSVPGQPMFGAVMPGQNPFFQQQMHTYQNLGYPGMYYGAQFGSGSSSQPSMMTPQDVVPSSSGQQWVNPYSGSAYNPKFDLSGSRQHKNKFEHPDDGSSN